MGSFSKWLKMAEKLDKVPVFSFFQLSGKNGRKRNVSEKVSVKSFGNNFEIRCKLHNYVQKTSNLTQKLHKIGVDAILKI